MQPTGLFHRNFGHQCRREAHFSFFQFWDSGNPQGSTYPSLPGYPIPVPTRASRALQEVFPFPKKKKKKGKTLKYGNMVFSLDLCYRKHQETRYLLTPQLVWAGQEYGFSETYWVSALADTLPWESPLSIGTNTSSTAAMIGNKQ